MPSSIVSPFPVFNDLDGTPLEAGYIYIGQSNLNPEVAPINVFWDAACTIPAAQPIRTVAGYPSRNGSPGNIYVSADTYSITVRNRNRVFVFAAFDQSDAPTSVFDISTQVITATAGQTAFALTTFTYLPGTDTLQVYRNGLRLINVVDYLETNSSTVTMVAASAAGDEFLFQGGSVVTGDQVLGSQVSFVQAGTGAVTRNMQDKARESVSVKDFGAVGDGVADDTAAIQAAIDYMSNTGSNVLLPPGIYLTNPFSIFSTAYAGQASFVGDDRERCVLRRKTAGYGTFVTYGSAFSTLFMSGIGFEGVTIDGGAKTNGPAFEGYDIVRSQFTNCRFTGGSVACKLNGGISITFTGCLFDAANRGLSIDKFTSLAGGGWPNAIRIYGGEIVDNAEWGIWFDNGRMLLVDGPDIEGNGTTLGTENGGIYIGPNIGAETSGTDPVSIGLIARSCWFEASRGMADIELNSGLNTVSDSNFFSQSTQATYDIKINGGKYCIRNVNCSFNKVGANIFEGASVFSGNIIEQTEANSLSFNAAKTAVSNGAWINLQQGRVPSINGMNTPMILMGEDTTGVNPAITFSTAFKTGTSPKVYCQVVNNGPVSLDAVETYAISRTGFTMRKKSFNGTTIGTSNYTVQWMAVGEAP